MLAMLEISRTALERLEQGLPGNFGYSLFAASRADVRRLRDLHLEYVRAMQQVIADSKPNECVGLFCAQLLDLSGIDNASRSRLELRESSLRVRVVERIQSHLAAEFFHRAALTALGNTLRSNVGVA